MESKFLTRISGAGRYLLNQGFTFVMGYNKDKLVCYVSKSGKYIVKLEYWVAHNILNHEQQEPLRGPNIKKLQVFS